MITTTFTLVANTPQVLLTGRYVIRQVVYNATGAGTVSLYDSATTSTTESVGSYTGATRDCSYSREVTGVRDLACNTIDYEFEGISDSTETVAADATAAKLVVDSLGVPAAGQTTADERLLVALGLMANSTVNATVQVTYEVAVGANQ